MASGSGSSNSWSFEQMKIVENAILDYADDDPDRWEKIAARVGDGKTAEDVKKYFDDLVEDVTAIISGKYDSETDESEETHGNEDAVESSPAPKSE